MKKFLKKDKKGFTLIEIVVVLAILAVLIAFLVPNLIGYLGTANDTSDLATAKLVYTSYVAEMAGDPSATIDADDVAEKAGLATGEVVIVSSGGTVGSTAGTAYVQLNAEGMPTSVTYNGQTYTN